MTSPTTHTANALAAINNKANIVIPEFDFTQHQLENGEVVSTTERVVKDVSRIFQHGNHTPERRGSEGGLASLKRGGNTPYPHLRPFDSPPFFLASGSYLGSKLISTNSSQVQAPAMYVPTDEQFWSKEDRTKPDIAFLKNHFYREGRLTEEQALYILAQ